MTLAEKKKGERGFTIIEDWTGATIQLLEEYVNNCKERLITVTIAITTGKQNLKEYTHTHTHTHTHIYIYIYIQLYGHFKRQTKGNCTQNDLNIAKKKNPSKWIFFNSNTK